VEEKELNEKSSDWLMGGGGGTSKTILDCLVSSKTNISLDRLIWARNGQVKRVQSPYFCARICDLSEGATEYIEGWPVKEDDVLVEVNHKHSLRPLVPSNLTSAISFCASRRNLALLAIDCK
jgi:hypothetical protein